VVRLPGSICDMGEPMKVRVREGCRGGQEQFKWNSLREQEFKDRECYLGQSTKVGMMGKFGHYYKHDWYAKKRDSAESIESEMDAVKAYEHELMQEALGLKPKKLILSRRQLSVEDLEEFLKKEKSQGGTRDGMGSQAQKIRAEAVRKEAVEEVEEDRGNMFGEASTKGLGFAPHRTTRLEEFKVKALGVTSELEGTRSAKGVICAKYKPELVLGGQKTDVKQESECASGRSCDRGVDKKEKKKNRNPEKSEKYRKKRNSNIERATRKADRAIRRADRAERAVQRICVERKRRTSISCSRSSSSS